LKKERGRIAVHKPKACRRLNGGGPTIDNRVSGEKIFVKKGSEGKIALYEQPVRSDGEMKGGGRRGKRSVGNDYFLASIEPGTRISQEKKGGSQNP